MLTLNDRTRTALYCAVSCGLGAGAAYVCSKLWSPPKSVSESTKLWKENPNLYRYIMRSGNRFIPELHDIHKETNEQFGETFGDWITSQDQCYLFVWLCKVLRVRKAIEVGVFTGSSALCIAQSIRDQRHEDGAQLVAIDHVSGQRFIEIAERHFKESKVDDIVSLRLKGGIDELDELVNDEAQLASFDFAYVDAQKTEYMQYYDRLFPLMRPGGVMAFDNTLLCGRVADLENLRDLKPEHIERVEYMARFNKKVRDDERVEICMIAIGDGLTLVLKK